MANPLQKTTGQHKGKGRFLLSFAFLILATVLMFYVHLRTGFAHLSDRELWQVILGGGTEAQRLTVFDFRMVRSLLAVLVGGGLAMSGALFQTISRNELASPSLLGVNAGAGLFVMLLIYARDTSAPSPFWQLPLAAVAGAALAALLIYRLAYRKGRTLSPYRLVLTGIALTAGIHALQLLLVVRLDPQKFHIVNTWIIGSLSGNTWIHAAALAPVVLLLGLLLWSRSMDLNLLSLADETAIGLGLPINGPGSSISWPGWSWRLPVWPSEEISALWASSVPISPGGWRERISFGCCPLRRCWDLFWSWLRTGWEG